MNKSEIVGYETRHVSYCTDYAKENDLLAINEYIHYEDGTREKNLRLIENHERDFWLVKPGRRTFNDTRQWIDEEQLDKYSTTQCDLYKRVNRILFKQYRHNKDALNDPYLFGCTTTPQSEIKFKYQQKWEKCISPMSSVAVLDTETDMLYGTGEIILITLSFKERIFCGIVRSFLKNTPDDIAREKADKVVQAQLGHILKERGAVVDYNFYDNAGDAVAGCIQSAHEWKPDFIIFWNMEFDMSKMLAALEKSGHKERDIFSDPRIPKKYRFFNWRVGPTKKMLHNGAERGLAPYERWHVATAPATFFFACAMATYYRLRMAAGKIPGGYGLDATLKRHLNLGKLKFEKADHLKGGEWHTVMQREYPYEYIAYNIFDCIGVEMLDEKTKDFSLKFNTRCTVADYTEFKSGPRITEVKMNYIVARYGKRLGTIGGDIRDELDKLVVQPEGWTMTLPSYIIEDSNVKVMKDWDTANSLVYFNVSDLDITSTYPAVQVALNISKPTTVREVVKVEGMDERSKRRMFVDMITGVSSAIEVCHLGFGLPPLDKLLDIYNEDKKETT